MDKMINIFEPQVSKPELHELEKFLKVIGLEEEKQ